MRTFSRRPTTGRSWALIVLINRSILASSILLIMITGLVTLPSCEAFTVGVPKVPIVPQTSTVSSAHARTGTTQHWSMRTTSEKKIHCHDNFSSMTILAHPMDQNPVVESSPPPPSASLTSRSRLIPFLGSWMVSSFVRRFSSFQLQPFLRRIVINGRSKMLIRKIFARKIVVTMSIFVMMLFGRGPTPSVVHASDHIVVGTSTKSGRTTSSTITAESTIIEPNDLTTETDVIIPTTSVVSRSSGPSLGMITTLGISTTTTSAMTFHIFRRRRKRGERMRQGRSIPPQDSDATNMISLPTTTLSLHDEEVTNLPSQLESKAPSWNVQTTVMSSENSRSSALAEKSKMVRAEDARKNSGGDAGASTSASGRTKVLQYDPSIQKEIHHNLDMIKEWTFLHQPAMNQEYPLQDAMFVEARRQPKSIEDQERLAFKYGKIDDLSERAFQILLDLGMIRSSTKPMLDVSKVKEIIDTDQDIQ